MKRLSLATMLFFLVLNLHCAKSWGKFWNSASASSFSLRDNVNFSTANFQASVYTGNNLWNDYVKNDGTPSPVTLVSSPFTAGSSATGQSTRLTATGTACSASQSGGYGTCIHAGMIRSFTISGLSSCAGLQVDDSLGAFHWVCDASTSPLRIASVGFKEGKYLSDLIDFTNVKFKAMSVTVSYQGQSVTSTPSVWWANPVQNLPSASYGVQSTIYLVQTNPNYGVQIFNNADKTALLIKPGIRVTPSVAVTILNNNGRNFTWYEGSLDFGGSGNPNAFSTGAGSYVVATNLAVANGPTVVNSSFLLGGKNGYFRDVRSGNATIASQVSFELTSGGDANLLTGLISTNDEFSMQVKSSNNVIMNFISANSGNGANVNVDYVTGANNNVAFNITSANNGTAGGIGAFRTSFGANNTIMNLSVANTPNPGYSGAGATGTQLINLALHTSVTPSLLVSANTFTYLTGVMKLAFLDCTSATPDSGILNATCTPQNTSDFTLVSTTLSPASAFRGKITSDDPSNSSDANGLATFNISIDWLNFSNRNRGYGLENVAAFPNTLHQRRCTTGPTCRIWDWSLLAVDTEYRNVLSVPSGNNTATHKWSAASQVNCTQPGAVWHATGTCQYPPFTAGAAACSSWTSGVTTNAACLTTFLRNAYEILDDGIGNENGLCESNEACIYTPNIASYQGHGNLTCIRGPADLGCTTTFTNGTITNVVLYQYATNGY